MISCSLLGNAQGQGGHLGVVDLERKGDLNWLITYSLNMNETNRKF